ncbi:MAG TPA: AmmeMemoRadiSam system protein B [Rubrivivax sp.]|nr:AmmeMemoRadiSam system protein B [Rubrivivax sp.]
MDSIRPAAVAGSFYPSQASALRAAVARHLANAKASARATAKSQAGADGLDRRSAPPKMLVVPHAGYIYSGDVAASAYAQLAPLAGRIRRVVLLGPTHRVAVDGIALPSVAAFETPLGAVPIDAAGRAAIAGLPQVRVSDRVHAEEHALEVQLPFLQTVLGSGWALLPLAVGDASPAQVDELLERVWGGDETLVLVSSDLSHYLPHAEAAAKDRRTAERILAFADDLRGDEACGCRALNGALRTARRHGLQPRLLDLRNSGDTAGPRDRVVGYGAIAFVPQPARSRDRDEDETCAGAGDGAEDGAVPADPALGRSLLGHARASIAAALGLPAAVPPDHPRLLAPGASFVTLRDARQGLRGCIGRLLAERPLGQDVRANARAAALEDPRFAPLRPREWEGLQLEVSVLGPLVPLPSAARLDEAAAQLQPGVDGVLIEHRGRRGTFLPQVWSTLPAAGDFLAALLQKAGLAREGWSAEIQWWRYRVTAFEEGDHVRTH